MKKVLKITIILFLTLTLILLIPKLNLTGKSISNNYSYTKAICNESGYCEDYIIQCSGEKLTKFNPTGLSIQQDDNWEDERENRELCEKSP